MHSTNRGIFPTIFVSSNNEKPVLSIDLCVLCRAYPVYRHQHRKSMVCAPIALCEDASLQRHNCAAKWSNFDTEHQHYASQRFFVFPCTYWRHSRGLRLFDSICPSFERHAINLNIVVSSQVVWVSEGFNAIWVMGIIFLTVSAIEHHRSFS